MSKATDSGRFLCSSTHMILIPRSCTRGCVQTDCTVSSYKKLLGIHEDTQAVLMRKFLIFCGTLIHWELAWALSREYDFFSRKPCFSLNMVGFGSPRQPRKKSAVKTPVKEAPPVDKTPLPNAPTAAGELPYDAFSQFPPLSPQNEASLRKVDGENDELTPEVLVQVRERHGFKSFNDKLFPTIRLLHGDPVVFEVEDFFTPEECDTYVRMSTEAQSGQRKGGFKSKEIRSATTSTQSQFQQHRTSTTWFHHYASAPELLAKASALLGVEDYRLWEEPQTVRYRPGERFNWHLDALPPSETGASKGGQRTATILVYLTDVDGNAGGATAFRDLGPLRVRPKKGKCLVFFPSFGGEAGCPFDVRTLHAGEVLGAGKSKLKEKYIAQLWCHKKPYPPSVPPGSSHEAATEYIADYNRRWGGKSKLDTSTET